MRIETKRLEISELNKSMAESIFIESQDKDNRRFLPDEVFESLDEAKEKVEYLIECYSQKSGPQVYAILLKNGTYIGHFQAVFWG